MSSANTYEVICAISNDYVVDDLGFAYPPPKTTKFFAFFVAFDIFVIVEHRDFKFGTQFDRS